MPFLRCQCDVKRSVLLCRKGRIWNGAVLPPASRRESHKSFVEADQRALRGNISVHVGPLAAYPRRTEGALGDSGLFTSRKLQELLSSHREALGRDNKGKRWAWG